MRDHIRREAALQEISPAWFVVPMSLAAAVLLAMAALGNGADAESPATAAPAMSTQPDTSAPVIVPSSSGPLPEYPDHVQAF